MACMKKIILGFFILLTFFVVGKVVHATTTSVVNLIVFERNDCAHCIAENAFLKEIADNSFVYVKKDIADTNTRKEFEAITKKYGLPLATPVTLIGNSVIAGFNTPETTGVAIKKAIAQAKEKKQFNRTIDYYLQSRDSASVDASAPTCGDGEGRCEVNIAGGGVQVSTQDTFSFLGFQINIKDMGLFSIAAILGTIDGFNPCAMWVLLTFLIALSQIGSRKKMAQIVGLFIVAEAVMYFLILNVWYQTWDFIKLDSYVTPAIGVFSVGAGLYFLYKWYKTKDELVCEVTNTEHQMKITTKIQEIAKKPMTIAVMFAVLAIAFSVNIIEFACSIGIAQTFTKILEINHLSFISQQFYILIYTIGYMIDDIIVFALALWGYKKFYAVGQKYSKHSTLIAGVLMIFLGVMLVFFRDFLVL